MLLPKIGNLAPVFSLPNQRGEMVSLKQFRGHKHIVLYFYPRAMTPGCTVQACGLRDIARELVKLEAVVLGVSPDSVNKLQKFVEKERLNFDLLSDADHRLAEKYGVWGPKKFMGKVFDGIHRTTFVITKDGRLRQIMAPVNTKTHHNDLLDCIRGHLA